MSAPSGHCLLSMRSGHCAAFLGLGRWPDSLTSLCICEENAGYARNRFAAAVITDRWHRNNNRTWVRDGWFVWRDLEPGWFIMKPIGGPVVQGGQVRAFKTARRAMRAADSIICIPKKRRSLHRHLL
jgi:hypothetical protein